MANLTLKNIPDDLYEQLKKSASANHRSLNNELIACLEKIFTTQRFSAQENIDRARALRKRIKATKISAQEITEAKHSGRS